MPRTDPKDLLLQAHRLAGSCAQGEDLAAEAVARCLAHPSPDGQQAPWLGRIFVNLAADHHRREARWSRLSRDGAFTAWCESGATTEHSPEQSLLAAERRRLVRRALARLSPRDRRVLLVRFYGDGSPASAARALGVPAVTLRCRVHRALARLRAGLVDLRVVVPLHDWFARLGLGAVAPAALTLALVVPRTTDLPTAAPAPAKSMAQAPRRDSRPARAPVPKPSPVTKPVSPKAAAPVATPPPPTPAVQRMTFDDDGVEGERSAPLDGLVHGRPQPAPRKSMIEIPDSFVAAIAASVDELD